MEEKRENYRVGLKEKTIEATQDSTAYERSRFDDLAHKACDAVVGAMAVESTTAHNNKTLTNEGGRKILDAVQKAVEIKYRLLDIPAPLQRHDIRDDRKAPADLTMEDIAENLRQFVKPDQLTFVIPADKFGGNGGDSGGQA